MRRLLFTVLLSLFIMNSAYAVEFKPLELPKNNSNTENTENTAEKEINVNNLETPKGLLSDDNYKFKGRIEYDEKGALFLNEEDIENLKVNIKQPKNFTKKSVFSDNQLFSKIEEQKRYETPKVDEYLGTPLFGSTEYKAGKNITYGTTFGTELDTAQVEYRTKLFARYDNKYFGLMTAVGKDAYTTSGRQMDSFYFIPELKINQGVSLLEVFKANPEYERCRNEIIVQYKPNIKNSRENVHLEAGLSQTNYYKSGDLFYQFSISTKFRF